MAESDWIKSVICAIFVVYFSPKACVSQVTCDGWKCLRFDGLNDDRVDLNGDWLYDPNTCHNSMYHYTSYDHPGIYLCHYQPLLNNWIFTDILCSNTVGHMLARCWRARHQIKYCYESDWRIQNGSGGEYTAPHSVSVQALDINCSKTYAPTNSPTSLPSLHPTFVSLAPTNAPSLSPTQHPSHSPTFVSLTPSNAPSSAPTFAPSDASIFVTSNPSNPQTAAASNIPSIPPTKSPTNAPSLSPSSSPSLPPTNAPSHSTTQQPSNTLYIYTYAAAASSSTIMIESNNVPPNVYNDRDRNQSLFIVWGTTATIACGVAVFGLCAAYLLLRLYQCIWVRRNMNSMNDNRNRNKSDENAAAIVLDSSSVDDKNDNDENICEESATFSQQSNKKKEISFVKASEHMADVEVAYEGHYDSDMHMVFAEGIDIIEKEESRKSNTNEGSPALETPDDVINDETNAPQQNIVEEDESEYSHESSTFSVSHTEFESPDKKEIVTTGDTVTCQLPKRGKTKGGWL